EGEDHRGEHGDHRDRDSLAPDHGFTSCERSISRRFCAVSPSRARIIRTATAAATPKWLPAMPLMYCSTGSVVLPPSGPPSRIAHTCGNTLKSHSRDRKLTSVTSGRTVGQVTE